MVNLQKVLTKIILRITTKDLVSGDDLNDIKGPGCTGFYYIRTGVANSPVEWATMLVIGGIGTSQIIFNVNSIRVRMLTGSPLAWTAWRTFSPT